MIFFVLRENQPSSWKILSVFVNFYEARKLSTFLIILFFLILQLIQAITEKMDFVWD